MSRSWPLGVAIRYSRAGARDHLVSFMSFISITGLVLGVAVLILVLSVMNGFERELRERVLGVLPHGVIYASRGFQDWEVPADLFERHGQVVGTAPLVEGRGLLVAGGEISGITFNGIVPERETRVSIMEQFFVDGGLSDLEAGSFKVALGKPLAKQLGVSPGDKVTVVLPDVQLTLAGPLPRMKRFEVAGIFHVGSDEDRSMILMNLNDAMKLRQLDSVEGIRIEVKDLFQAPRVLQELDMVMERDDLHAVSWMQHHGNLYDAIQMQKSTMFLLLLLLVAVAAFNVIANLVLTVKDKRSDIAILRTLGASPRSIMAIFVLHGGLVGTTGVFVGLFLGVTSAFYAGDIYQFVESNLGLGLMDEYFIHYLPTRVLAGDVITVGLISLAICLLVTIYPAYKASKELPVEALQYDG